jgi:hypothetical protein
VQRGNAFSLLGFSFVHLQAKDETMIIICMNESCINFKKPRTVAPWKDSRQKEVLSCFVCGKGKPLQPVQKEVVTAIEKLKALRARVAKR